MEVYSGILCKIRIPWLRLLFTASLLTYWHLPTTAHITIESVPPQVVEGENIFLHVHNVPENAIAVFWHKGVRNMSLGIGLYSLLKNASIPGTIHSGRETVHSNGSLQIYNVTQKDTGFYTVRIINRHAGIVSMTTTYLHVYTSPMDCEHPRTSAQPTVESVPPSVAEGANVLLLVQNLPENLLALFWYKGITVLKNLEIVRHIRAKNSTVLGPSHSGRETVYSNGSLLLQNVTWEDTGLYTLQILNADMNAEVLHVQVQVNTYGCTSTSAQPTIESVPPSVAEGASVLLDVQNLPENLRALLWYKGVSMSNNLEVVRHIITENLSVPGPAHSGRETVYSNGSLLIHNVTWKDSGFYTLKTLSKDTKMGLVHVKLLVNTSLSICCDPFMIEAVPRNATEGESVLLLVQNMPEDVETFSWYKGMYSIQIFKMADYNRSTNFITLGPAHSRRAIMYANGSMLLQHVTETDAGLYTLQTSNRDLKTETTHVQLHVNTCRHPPTTTKLTIESVPPNVVEGENALLLVENIPENLRGFSWYKGVATVNSKEIVWYTVHTNTSLLGPAHSGRETVYPNGSLLLHNVTQKDTGFYTLRTLTMQLKVQETRVRIHIYKPVAEPLMRVTGTTVTVQSSVVFTCISADPGTSIHWIFNNQSLQLTERIKLFPQKCRLSIDPVRKEDAGEYKCEVSNPVSSKTSFPIRLAVINE